MSDWSVLVVTLLSIKTTKWQFFCSDKQPYIVFLYGLGRRKVAVDLSSSLCVMDFRSVTTSHVISQSPEMKGANTGLSNCTLHKILVHQKNNSLSLLIFLAMMLAPGTMMFYCEKIFSQDQMEVKSVYTKLYKWTDFIIIQHHFVV